MISPRDDMPPGLVQQLLSAARSRSAADRPQPEAEDYPFDRPSRFTRVQLETLERFGACAVDAARANLSKMLQTPVTLTRGGFRQHYAGSLKAQEIDKLRHVAAISLEDGQPAGWVGISAASASQWLARLLGGCESAESANQAPRELSDLERELLLDIAAGLVEAFSTTARQFACPSLTAGRTLDAWPDACSADDTDEYCLLELSTGSDSPGGAAILLAGHVAGLLAGEAGPGDVAKADAPPMLGHVHRTSVEARAMMSATLRVCDVMALSPGDVVVLDQRIDEPIGLEVDGRCVLKGHPARHHDRVALQFAGFCEDKKTKAQTNRE